jgi:hypothetical protein
MPVSTCGMAGRPGVAEPLERKGRGAVKLAPSAHAVAGNAAR